MSNDSQHTNGKNGGYKVPAGVKTPPKIPRFDALAPAVDPDDQEAPKEIAALTMRERNILIKIIAKYENIAIIRMVLSEEYPDFPPVSDPMMRYYRRKIQAGAYKEAQQSMEQAIRASIARKGFRLAHLGRMFDRAISVDALRESTFTDSEGNPQTKIEFNQHLAAHQRELLRQAREEIEGKAGGAGALGGSESDGDGEESEEDTDERRAALAVYVAAYKEHMSAAAQALQAAQPPAEDDQELDQ